MDDDDKCLLDNLKFLVGISELLKIYKHEGQYRCVIAYSTDRNGNSCQGMAQGRGNTISEAVEDCIDGYKHLNGD